MDRLLNRTAPLAAAVAAGLFALAPAAARADDGSASPASTAPALETAVGETMTEAPAAAPEGQGEADPLERRVKELEETVRQLQDTIKKLQAAPKPETPVDNKQVEKIVDDKLKAQKPLVGWQNGFFIESPDGNHRLRIRGLIQADQRAFTSGGGHTGTDSFFLRRVRPILEGTVYKYFDFRLMPDFGQGTTVLQDAWVNYHYSPQLQLQAGKFKEPVSLERLQAAADVNFVERSLSQNLAPNRDVGVQLFGDTYKGLISYALGGFDGVPDGGSADGDNGNDKDFVGRVFAQPFKKQPKSPFQGLGFGVAGSIGKRDESLSGVVFRTAGRSPFFRYRSTVVGGGDQRRLVPQFYYYWGPLGIMGEHLTSWEDVTGPSGREDLKNQGYFLQATWVVTGEKASYQGVTPRAPFDPKKGHWGAVELGARYSRVRIDGRAFDNGFADPAVSAERAYAYTFGLNWYLNRALKLQLNYEHTNFDHAIKVGTSATDHEDVFISRFQVAF